MDDVQIQDRIATLDALVPKEGAVVKLDQYGGGPDESRITANKNGYLRLGIELLKGAYLPAAENQQIPVDLYYLMSDDSNVGFDWFERPENPGLPLHDTRDGKIARNAGRVIAAGFLLIFVIVIAFLAMIGIKTIAGWVLK